MRLIILGMKLPEKVILGLRYQHAHGLLPATLTLQQLADMFGVSLTPVRQAVAQLVEGGELVRRSGGRLQVGRMLPAGEDPAAASGPEQKLENWLIGRMLLDTAAQFLREEDLSRRFGVGRTVLRRMLSHWAGSGLIEHVPRRGWRLAPITDDDIRGFIEVRTELECIALRSSWPRLDRKRLRELRELNTGGDMDNSLHDEWIRGCANRSLRSFFIREAPLYADLFSHAIAAPELRALAARQHVAILDAILRDEQALALRLLAEHIRQHFERVHQLRSAYTQQLASGRA